ncbi:hypothetical protein [Streptomyces corynorhini]|uniref:Uncharacterized protein n=1 Tax=Streptomyces corynorhini TaxID=2282652 RepID=A0A370BAV4_9ACTN|nr:hypothetical protein [Streptomyces corynorhini]RDG36565.1 hypothetical protein DVH02_19250 [Streptomyces corynorhini]
MNPSTHPVGGRLTKRATTPLNQGGGGRCAWLRSAPGVFGRARVAALELVTGGPDGGDRSASRAGTPDADSVDRVLDGVSDLAVLERRAGEPAVMVPERSSGRGLAGPVRAGAPLTSSG